MTKAEMEIHQERYQSLMAQARSAEANGKFDTAVDLASAAWDHVDGAMQFESKYESGEFGSTDSFDLVLEYAPLLFDARKLDALDSLLESSRRIERNAAANLPNKLTRARALMWDAHRLWDHLERNREAGDDDLRQSLGGDQGRWRSIADKWTKMGLLRRTQKSGSCRLKLVTLMDEQVSAKCSACGVLAEAPKAHFLVERLCSNCGRTVPFVILAEKDAEGAAE